MALTYRGLAITVRGRLNLPSVDTLRIQKSIKNALQVLSERLAMDENKRHIILTPRTVTGTPTQGILDLTALVNSNGIMIDKLHLGFIYNGNRTFSPSDVAITPVNEITIVDNGFADDLMVRFTSLGTLPAPLAINTDYYIETVDNHSFQLYTTLEAPRIILTTTGTGTHTVVTPNQSDSQPLMHKNNQFFASDSLCFANSSADKFWWLVGQKLYAFDGTGNPITTGLQFNVPHFLALSEFSSNSAIATLEDELTDILVEIVRDTETDRDNEG